MANYFVRSTTGSDANDGLTWATAKATIPGARAVAAAGDWIFVSQAHAEALAATTVLTFAGTVANPIYIVCVNDGATPATTLANTATVTLTGSGVSLQMTGSLHVHGISFINNGTGGSGIWLSGGLHKQIWTECSFQINSTTASSIFINSASTTTGDILWRKCTIKFGNVASAIVTNASLFRWEEGSVLSGSANANGLLNMGSTRCNPVELFGVDFSNFGAGFNFLQAGAIARLLARQCRTPASWTGSIHSGTMTNPSSGEVFLGDNGDTNYRRRKQDSCGDLREETVIVKTGGATDGTTPQSWKTTTTANANRATGRFTSFDLNEWNATAGTPITLKVDMLRDNVADLTTADVALEVGYFGTSGNPLGVLASTAASVLDAGTAYTSSGATWTTTGMSNPNEQIMSLTITPAKSGPMWARIVVTRGSDTIYFDFELQVS